MFSFPEIAAPVVFPPFDEIVAAVRGDRLPVYGIGHAQRESLVLWESVFREDAVAMPTPFLEDARL